MLKVSIEIFTMRLRDIRAYMVETGIVTSFVPDLSIICGIDYYTGVVYETFLNDLPSNALDSSDGRYVNLV